MKRYVLLEELGKIFDLTNEKESKSFDSLKNGSKFTFKYSDNLLDLLEVGDMVELDNEWELLKVLRFNKDSEIVCMVRTSSNTEEYRFCDYRSKRITAIWKRNGDIMRRYER